MTKQQKKAVLVFGTVALIGIGGMAYEYYQKIKRINENLASIKHTKQMMEWAEERKRGLRGETRKLTGVELSLAEAEKTRRNSELRKQEEQAKREAEDAVMELRWQTRMLKPVLVYEDGDWKGEWERVGKMVDYKPGTPMNYNCSMKNTKTGAVQTYKIRFTPPSKTNLKAAEWAVVKQTIVDDKEGKIPNVGCIGKFSIKDETITFIRDPKYGTGATMSGTAK